MRLIVNTNRIIAALIRDSFSRKIILHLNAELIAIPFLQQELAEHKLEILQKSKLPEFEFDAILDKLHARMILLDQKVIEEFMKEAIEIMDKIDSDDAPFIAAALATKSDIWSDDPHFQQQKKIKIWRTKDLTSLV